jgi:hypothetical protein
VSGDIIHVGAIHFCITNDASQSIEECEQVVGLNWVIIFSTRNNGVTSIYSREEMKQSY